MRARAHSFYRPATGAMRAKVFKQICDPATSLLVLKLSSKSREKAVWSQQ
jgi:hypothetical protein